MTEKRSTATTAAVAPPPPLRFIPEWIRLPSKGVCPLCGLSRSFIYGLITASDENGHSPPVRSVSLRSKGALRGVRLVHYESLMAYIGKSEAA